MRLRLLLVLVLVLGALSAVDARPAGAIPYSLKPVVTLGNHASLDPGRTRLTLHLAITCTGPLQDVALTFEVLQGTRGARTSVPWTCTGSLRHLDVAVPAPAGRHWVVGTVDEVLVSVRGAYPGWGTSGRPLGEVQFESQVRWTALVAGAGPPAAPPGSRSTSPAPVVLVFRDEARLRDGGHVAELTYRVNCPVPVAPVPGTVYSHVDVLASTSLATGHRSSVDVCTGGPVTRTISLAAVTEDGQAAVWQGPFVDVCVDAGVRTGEGPEVEQVSIRNDCRWAVPLVS